MTKKITVVISSVLAMTLAFACGLYVGQVGDDTTAKSGDNIIISQEMYSVLLDYMRLDEIARYIEGYYIGEYEYDNLYNGAARGMVYSIGDIYADYYTAEEYQELLHDLEGNYTGIGVRMTEDPSDAVATIISVFNDSPAMDAGLLPGDRIVAVEGIDVRGLALTEITSMVRGEEGTSVNVTFQRDGEYFDHDFTRREVLANNVEYRMIGDVGYIKINTFEGDCVDGFKEAVAFVESNGASSLIIDLRYNGGGLVDYAVEIADILLPKGLVVYTEDKYGNRDERSSDIKYLGLPLAILVNEYTASASEILAGAIQDYEAGVLVGVQTFGKGIVQGYIPFNDGAHLKLTIANYYTPSGRNIHGEGLAPDYVIENSEEANSNPYLTADEEDAQLQKALEVLP